jgi:hypothetical protein
MRSVLMTLAILLALLIVPPLLTAVAAGSPEHWSRARWDSAGLAPDPAATPEAVIQVYAARSWGWRGALGVHTWLVYKPSGAPAYERYEVVGWGVGRGSPAVRRGMRVPDGYWAGNPPTVLADLRGDGVDALIAKVEAAIADYPYHDTYRLWPGPNSNTFVAHIAREVPELGLALPPLAVGKDYLGGGRFVARTPSGTGYQVSLFGLFGLSIGRAEGLELNLLGLTLGVDPLGPAIKLPGIGRLGFGGGQPGL